MPTHWIHKIADIPLERLFLAAVLVSVGGLLVAMYMVCDAQTRQADQRRAELRAQRAAVMDCLATRTRASYALCETEVALQWAAQPSPTGEMRVATAQPGSVTTLVPVVFSTYR